VSDLPQAPTCKCGAPVTKVFKSGKPGKYCQDCMSRNVGQPKGAWRRGDIACAHCRIVFAPEYARQRFCSEGCQHRDRGRRQSVTGLARADYLAERTDKSKARLAFTCAQCGSVGHRRVSASNAASGYTNKYCSLPCRDAAYTAAALVARLGKGLYSNCFGLHCKNCMMPFVSRRQKAFCSAACAAEVARTAARAYALAAAKVQHVSAARSVPCRDCGLEFCPLYGYGGVSLCVPCAHSKKRAQRSAAKALRRLRTKLATVEDVDPIVVFERDGWVCRLCGIATPREKRGVCEPDAPELDHIIALAAGGEHSYRNTQCACRRCNLLKSDKPIEDALALLAGAASM